MLVLYQEIVLVLYQGECRAGDSSENCEDVGLGLCTEAKMSGSGVQREGESRQAWAQLPDLSPSWAWLWGPELGLAQAGFKA